jgi:hypothetical protein
MIEFDVKKIIEKNVVHRIDFNRDKPITMDMDSKNTIFKMTNTIATQCVEQMDNEIFNMLYQAYKDTECDTLLILDKSEFKRFILKYLPIYIKERNEVEE